MHKDFCEQKRDTELILALRTKTYLFSENKALSGILNVLLCGMHALMRKQWSVGGIFITCSAEAKSEEAKLEEQLRFRPVIDAEPHLPR